MTAPQQQAEPAQDPRIALALSILQHADQDHAATAIDRAVLALQGATITEILELGHCG